MALPDFAEGLRRSDPERFLSLLYAPAEKREALAALYAFDGEIAGIRDRVREPLPGEIRLQWWRDALSAGEATGNPLADALIETVRAHGLPLPAFENYLEARVFDLYDDPMETRNDLEGYLGETEGAVIQLAALVLDRAGAIAHAAIAGHAGCARGIVAILRRLRSHPGRGAAFVPGELLAAAGITREALVRGGEGQSQSAITGAMKALAEEHYRAFLAASRALPATLRPAYLPLATVPHELRQLSFAGEHQPAIPPWKRQWLMLRAGMGSWPGL